MDETTPGVVETIRGAVSSLPITGGRGENQPSPEAPGRRGREWEVEVSADGDAPGVGDSVTFSKQLRESDVEQFAAVSGDTNPVHLDDGYAGRTQFGGRIAHGLLVAGPISAALARLPGLTIYLSQDLEFRAPVCVGDRVTAEIEVVESLGDDRYRIRTTVENGDATAIDGEAVVQAVQP